MSEYVTFFTIGQSIFVTIFPMLYLHHVYETLSEHEKAQVSVSLNTLNVSIPVAMGVLFSVLYPLLRDIGIPRKIGGVYVRFSIAGALAALCISLVLDYVFNVYDKWLQIRHTYTAHLTVAACYFFIFQIIGVWVYKRLGDYYDDGAGGGSGGSAAPSPPISRAGSVVGSGSGSASSSGSSSAGSSSGASSASESLYDKLAAAKK